MAHREQRPGGGNPLPGAAARPGAGTWRQSRTWNGLIVPGVLHGGRALLGPIRGLRVLADRTSAGRWRILGWSPW